MASIDRSFQLLMVLHVAIKACMCQNGVAERRHRHIVETGLALLHYAHLPLSFWTHAFQTAVYLINRLPTPILDFQCPYFILYNQKPTYDKLKPFGCLCYPWLRPYAKSKLHPRSEKCLFLGYSSSKSAYKCYDYTNRRLYHSRHVEFIESEFPLKSPSISMAIPTVDKFLGLTSAQSIPLAPHNINHPLSKSSQAHLPTSALHTNLPPNLPPGPLGSTTPSQATTPSPSQFGSDIPSTVHLSTPTHSTTPPATHTSVVSQPPIEPHTISTTTTPSSPSNPLHYSIISSIKHL
ncbi:hypothetical protein E3N88_24225 [Mikania micrantha]|uniref:Retroviral polymerase SH3-like domain-containing protein n=1 Tax=Mikania micrantha TaxID=192012 RepID=A0A5N6NFP3_9ASTR|nr:hypothetical protein E3N88_24225 [Mikania micrantha]